MKITQILKYKLQKYRNTNYVKINTKCNKKKIKKNIIFSKIVAVHMTI